MDPQSPMPMSWLRDIATTLQWPALVAAAFWGGRHLQDLETRLEKSEAKLAMIVERHMPAIHKALARIEGLLIRSER